MSPQEAYSDVIALGQDPERARRWQLVQRAQLDEFYAPLFRELALPPEKLARLKQLLLERDTATFDVVASLAARGEDPAKAPLTELSRAIQDEVDARIAAELGEDVRARFYGYYDTLPQRRVVGALENRLSYGGEPLSPDQSRRLAELMAKNAATRFTDEVVSRAAEFLSPAQLGALRDVQAEQAAGLSPH